MMVFAARAEVVLPPIFSEHAVVQRSDASVIWGTADAGEKIEVQLAGASATVRAGDDGRWRARLDLGAAPEGPHSLVVRGSNERIVPDVLIGDVWLCSGQSNMAWRLQEADSAATELARPANPRLRQFLTTKRVSAAPSERPVEGRWIVAEGENRGRFTAVGYHFADAVQREAGTAIGLLDISVGATPIETWMSAEAFESDPALKAVRDRVLEHVAEHPTRLADYLERFDAWTKQHRREDAVAARPKRFTHPRANTDDWKRITLPGRLAEIDAALPDAGTIWLRKHVRIPADMANRYLVLQLGRITGFHSVFWNGEQIAESTPRGGSPPVARHRIDKVTEGEGVLAIRIYNPIGGLALGTPGMAFRAGDIDLGGEWLLAVERALPPIEASARASYPAPIVAPRPETDRPAHFFNSLLYPITDYAIRGVVWYQGEADVGRADRYARAFPALIRDWRARWRSPGLPFYFCQLAGYGAPAREPGESAWAELREAQSAALSLPHTGQAVLIDLGESADIHPRNKRDVGERLARIALADTYGRKIVSSGPVLLGAEFRDGVARLRFDPAGGRLIARDGEKLTGFALRESGGPWVWADARIEDDMVVISAPGRNKPVAVRYAWADFPRGNLYNSAGLPAAPFRTDAPVR